MPQPEPMIRLEQDDGGGGDLPGWYLRRYAVMPIKAGPGGGISVAGPFPTQAEAVRWFGLRSPAELTHLLPIPPAALMVRQSEALEPAAQAAEPSP